MKIGKGLTFAALFPMLLVLIAGCGQKAPQQPEKIVLGPVATVNASPIWIAENKGYFQEEGLKVLIANPEDKKIDRWNGPYLRKSKIPLDAWNREFVYEIPPKHPGVSFDLYSLGADGKAGGTGEDADIGNWE